MGCTLKSIRYTFLRNRRTSLQAIKGILALIYRSSVSPQGNSYIMLMFGMTISILEIDTACKKKVQQRYWGHVEHVATRNLPLAQ